MQLSPRPTVIGSLIPSTNQSFGTPLVDALRRDITINSLFYNVHSRSIEDFTEKVCLFDIAAFCYSPDTTLGPG